ncbi:hypothetical protein ACIBI4_09350 [Streptomyces sp. NPDC050418]|uniref:hypothetical protein n=1 Tax=Streptomyces sp. NPDC050418 TaxID=3365612 RepID=UPI00379B3937
MESTLLWLGVEDYTGLWEAALEASAVGGPCSPPEVQERARRTIESLLVSGFIELFACREPMNNDGVRIVSPDHWAEILGRETCWTSPEPGGESIRFASTDRGFAAYREVTGWSVT